MNIVPEYAPPNDILTNQLRGIDLRGYLARSRADDRLKIDRGIFDTGKATNVILPNSIHLLGQGPDKTKLVNGFAGDVTPGCCFECSGGTSTFENLAFAVSSGPLDQSMTIGFGRTTSAITGAKLVFVNCWIDGGNFALYDWHNGNTIILDHCRITGAHWIVGRLGSGGWSTMELHNGCKIVGDSRLRTNDIDLRGIVCRGGIVKSYGTIIELNAEPKVTAQRGAWIDPSGNSGAAIELHDTTIRFVGTNTSGYDLDGRAITTFGGSGDGPAGAFTRA